MKLIGCSGSDELIFTNTKIIGSNNIINMNNTIHVEFTAKTDEGETSTKFRDRKIIITGFNKP